MGNTPNMLLWAIGYARIVETANRSTHVDDLVWAVENKYEWIIDAIKQELTFGSMDTMKIRFCGREVEQSDKL